MPVPFLHSPNLLFETIVDRTDRLSPGFIRITLTGDSLRDFAPYERDQRIKILLPDDDGAYPSGLRGGMPEHVWRRAWRELPVADRPVMRSYTAHRVRAVEREIDLDVFIHQPAGPASQWALQATRGDRLLLSGPDVRRGDPTHGVQWAPGTATTVLIAGDETAFPAILGIVQSLDEHLQAHLILELGDPADTALLEPVLDRHTTEIHERAGRTAGDALVAAVDAWLDAHGPSVASRGTDFAAWLVTESCRVPHLRRAAADHGIDPGRVHTQGYWNAHPRAVER